MFNKIHNDYVKSENTTNGIKKHTFKNILFEFFEVFQVDLKSVILSPRPRTKEIKMRLHVIREDFYENSKPTFFSTIFRTEWRNLYVFFIETSPRFWFLIMRPLNSLAVYFYSRSKNIKSTLNIVDEQKYNKHTGKIFFNIYWGLLHFWRALRIWFFSGLFFIGFFYLLLLKRTAILPQTLFFWVSFAMLLYWLLSGFVFFVKKYQYSRYTSVIQRFWRRSYILFWLIESGLLLVFFYLSINSSQESFYMFDQGYFLKSHLFSWRIFLFKAILVVGLIVYSYLFLLNLKWSTFNKNILFLAIMTGFLTYFLWIEFYQIYWVSNFYANFSWMYDFEEAVWSLEWDARRTRILNHYIMILFILKFWHIVFIYGCWIFFLLRANELDTVTYPLYSFNVQNFLILFIMMWLFMYPWVKHTFHWLSELPYFWFYVDTHISFFKILVNDLYWFYYNVYFGLLGKSSTLAFVFTDFVNWALFDSSIDSNTFIKSTIKELILRTLIS